VKRTSIPEIYFVRSTGTRTFAWDFKLVI